MLKSQFTCSSSKSLPIIRFVSMPSISREKSLRISHISTSWYALQADLGNIHYESFKGVVFDGFEKVRLKVS